MKHEPVKWLSGDFDPRKLDVGAYAARSDTGAYNILMALGMTEFGHVVGERDLEGGAKVVAVKLRRRLSSGMIMKINGGDTEEHMGLDPAYFSTVKREYSDWREKFWRELMQNAVDAGATRIDLSVTQNEDGTWLCVCDDDGGGMSLDVLRQKFLRFGGTTKRGEGGASGGFGKAKELILLPWLGWRVHTRDNIAIGIANRFRIESAPTTIKGTRVEVSMASDDHTDVASAKAFIAKCNLPGIKLSINGERMKAAMSASNKLFDIGDKAEVHFNKGISYGSYCYYYVRTKGPRGSLFMFSGYVSNGVGGTVIVEITKPSIDILTANRDGFADWRVRSEFEEFVNRIAADVSSALQKKNGIFEQKFEGSGRFRAPESSLVLSQVGPLVKRKSKPSRAGSDSSGDTDGIRVKGDVFEIDDESRAKAVEVISHYEEKLARDAAIADRDGDTSASNQAIIGTTTGAAASEMMRVPMFGQNHLEAAMQQLAWRPDFFMLAEIEKFRVPKKFYPATMTPRTLHLAKVWTELCRYVLIQLGSRSKFGVGWIFSTSAGAAYHPGGAWLLLNPFVDVAERSEIWRPTDPGHLKWLYASAIHECTHMFNGLDLHNESFAAALTNNMARCADGWSRVKRIVSSIKMRGGGVVESDE